MPPKKQSSPKKTATTTGSKKPQQEIRSFTVEAASVGQPGGRYESKTPSSAASKAATQIFNETGTKQKSIKVQIREMTQGSRKHNKLFAYEATREDIKKTVKINGKDVTFNKTISLKKIPLFHGDGARRTK